MTIPHDPHRTSTQDFFYSDPCESPVQHFHISIFLPYQVPQYKLRVALPKDYVSVMEFMAVNYLQYEPSIVNIGKLFGPESRLLNRQIESNITKGMTLIVEDKTCDRIVGAAVNTDSVPEHIERSITQANCMETGLASDLVKFYAFCSSQANPWKIFNVNVLFECAYVAVDPEHQGRGVGRKLIIGSWLLGRDLGYPLFRIDCSSRLGQNDLLPFRCMGIIPT